MNNAIRKTYTTKDKIIRTKRVSNCYIPKKKSVRVSCVVCTANNLGFMGVVKTLLLSHATTGGVQKGSVDAFS